MPAYIAPKNKLASLRKRAVVAKLIRDIECGKWKKFLIDLKNAAHRYKEIQTHSGKIEPLIVKVNAVRLAIRFHTMVLTGTPITVSTPDGFDAQRQAVTQIQSRSMFNALAMQCARRANIESFASMRVAIDPDHGVVICADDNAVAIPVGPDGPDMQPTVWERRWIIERKDASSQKVTKYLRVERHRAPGGVGVVEQEAFKVSSTDIYQCLSDLTEVKLETALPGTTLEPVTLTGVPYPLITRLVHEYYEGQPELLLSEHDLDILDLHASALSRFDRTMEQHGTPKARVSSGMVDEETGMLNISEDGIVDEEKIFEYLQQTFNFDSMLKYMNKTLQLLFAQLQLSPALVGIKLEGGAMPDTVDKLRLEASNTLARGRTSAMYFQPAFQRVMDIAVALDTRLPMKGYPTAPVGVTVHPGLPRDPIDIAREMQELRGSGGADALVDRRTAIETIWGDSAADGIHERLLVEDEQRIQNDQRSLMGAFGGGTA